MPYIDILNSILQHRRALIRELGNPSDAVTAAVRTELQATSILSEKIEELINEMRARLEG